MKDVYWVSLCSELSCEIGTPVAHETNSSLIFPRMPIIHSWASSIWPCRCLQAFESEISRVEGFHVPRPPFKPTTYCSDVAIYSLSDWQPSAKCFIHTTVLGWATAVPCRRLTLHRSVWWRSSRRILLLEPSRGWIACFWKASGLFR